MTIKQKDPKPYFLTSADRQTWPQVGLFHHCIVLFITFDLICNMIMFVQNGSWTVWGHTSSSPTPIWPCPRLHQNSECVPPVHIHRAIACERFRDSSLNGQGAMVDITDGRTDGARFFFEKRGDNYSVSWHEGPDQIAWTIWMFVVRISSKDTFSLGQSNQFLHLQFDPSLYCMLIL